MRLAQLRNPVYYENIYDFVIIEWFEFDSGCNVINRQKSYEYVYKASISTILEVL